MKYADQSSLQVEFDEDETMAVIRPVIKDLNFSNVAGLKAQLADQIENLEKSLFVFDCEHVAYLDSSAIGYIIHLQQKLKKKGCVLALVTTSQHIHELMRYTFLDKLIQVCDNIADAKIWFSQAKNHALA